MRICLFKLCYARAHSASVEQNQSAAEIAEEMYEQQVSLLAKRDAEGGDDIYEGVSLRDLLYVLGVANFNAGSLLKARKYLTIALEKYPSFNQAKSLKNRVDDDIVKEGMYGLGLVAGGAALLGSLIAVAAMSGRR